MSATMDHSHQQERPRSKSTFSYHSGKSHDSPSKSKHERKESASEKRKTHYDPSTKANPNAAMNEAQPIAAALEKPTLQSLRSFQHNDAAGNPIADPDLSNPTRSRWERPLDTVRSFEAAIDGEYKRRAASMRADQTDVMSGYGSRRSSYYGGGGAQEQNRYSTASYYGNNRQTRDNFDNGYGMGGPVGGPPRLRYGNRMQSDPGWNRQNGNNVYPVNGYQQSRDTVNTNGSNGSHSDGPYSNDPASENSSIERGVPVKAPQSDMSEQYGYNGYGRGQNMGDFGQGPSNGGYYPQQQQNGANGGPPPPPKHVTQPAPIKLNSSGPSSGTADNPHVLSKNNGGDDKRRSWFKRRFSKD
ncbi:uncharacterized protein K460DRAFT_215127 [Cucurbitaria berberidis CBS 394.84]|uniref:Uncharacterized protein n=1 Tax=Cucurbitaria berberidis CBS 394.84 TaxID=1168544 RepID=A0A9P4G6T7_9PLEO|nr:uncharacterized protein K460DRAFT_215127 [Cucurbitaria berberidis CBS 394.84]KAF1840012.1 hypothetical protein K460DRAFT_215127 [Cucurbitaria berberidis CBS 394.84]